MKSTEDDLDGIDDNNLRTHQQKHSQSIQIIHLHVQDRVVDCNLCLQEWQVLSVSGIEFY